MYEDRIVFYIDILGFTSFILDKENKYKTIIEESMNSILKISEIFHKSESSKIDVNTSIMSDSIVCSFLVSNRAINILNLSAVFLACIAFQISLLKSGILSRGAIVRGGLNHRDNLVYGPAMIEAYNIERNLAVFPRVILNQAIKNFIDIQSNQRLSEFITLDDDSNYYIDYISKLEDFDVGKDDVMKIIMEKNSKENEKVQKKYLWIKEKL